VLAATHVLCLVKVGILKIMEHRYLIKMLTVKIHQVPF
jgi:hypothetical protein